MMHAGKETVIADSISGNDIVVAHNGNIYVTAPDGIDKPSRLYLIHPDGKKEIVDEGLKFANGLFYSRSNTIVCYGICFPLGMDLSN